MAVRYLSHLAAVDEPAALHALRLPLLKTIEQGDAAYVQFLLHLAHKDPAGLHEVLSHPNLNAEAFNHPDSSIPILYLASRRPESAVAIRDMDWVQDGITGFEMFTVGHLTRLALQSSSTFTVMVEKKRSWLPPGPWVDVDILRLLVSISDSHEEVAQQIMEMPFLESIEFVDVEALRALAELAAIDPVYLQEVLSRLASGDEGAEDIGLTISFLRLKRTDPEAAAAIEQLTWVQDGINKPPPGNVIVLPGHPTEHEQRVVLDFFRLAIKSRPLLMSLLSKPWVQDDLTLIEMLIIRTIIDLSDWNREEGVRIGNMPFLNTAERDDRITLEILHSLRWSDPNGLKELLHHPDLSGGIKNDQWAIVQHISLEVQDPEAATAIAELPWVLDGIDSSERSQISAIRSIALESLPVFWGLVNKLWVQDGLSAKELSTVEFLTDMSLKSSVHRAESEALNLLSMPFLESVNWVEAVTVESLHIVSFKQDVAYLRQVLSHPHLQGGITDDQTSAIAVLYEAVDERPELLNVLLDPEQTIVKERSVTLPYSGEVVLAVVWPGDGGTDTRASQTLDLLEHAVRTQEEFMGVVYPKDYAIMLIADVSPYSGGGGARSIITIDPPFFEDYSLIAHEAAHTYWNVSPAWFQEGGATFLEMISTKARTGGPFPQPSNSCDSITSLDELRRVELENVLQGTQNDFFHCNYSLGSAMFLDLYDNLGDKAFRQGFAKLYVQLRDRTLREECGGEFWSVCNIKEAFITGATLENAAIAEAIINRRYFGDQS